MSRKKAKDLYIHLFTFISLFTQKYRDIVTF